MGQFKREIKLIEISFSGDNSVKGTIFKEHGLEVLNQAEGYAWLIGSSANALEVIEAECKEMKLQEYIVFDIRSAKVGNDPKNTKK